MLSVEKLQDLSQRTRLLQDHPSLVDDEDFIDTIALCCEIVLELAANQVILMPSAPTQLGPAETMVLERLSQLRKSIGAFEEIADREASRFSESQGVRVGEYQHDAEEDE